MTNSRYVRRLGACAVILSAAGLAACKSDSTASEQPAAQTVTVVGTDSAEGKLLTEIYAEALEGAGFRVGRREPVTDLAAGYAALSSGAADLFLTHTNDLLTYVVQQEPAAAASTSTTAATTTTIAATTTTAAATPTTSGGPTVTPPAEATTTTAPSTAGQAEAISISGQSNQIGEILPDTLQIGSASNAQNKNIIACNGTVLGALNVTVLSQLAAVSDTMRIAGPPEFETGDPFGLPGFEKAYGGTFKEFVSREADKVGDAIAEPTTTTTEPASTTSDAASTTSSTVASTDGITTTTAPAALNIDAECGAFNSLDITIPNDATELGDDKDWITTNAVIPLMSAAAYTPGVSQVLDQVSQTLRTGDMRIMLKQMNDGAGANVVASSYLSQMGITGG